MGPPEGATRRRKNQAAGRRKRRRGRPRPCLLKGCEKKFRPRQARQRYCSEGCRAAARKWSRWKGQQKYRSTEGGKQKRNGQSRRYRERVKSRKRPEPEAVNEATRVITQEHFFRSTVRPAGMLRAICAAAAKSFAALLFADLPARPGTGAGAGAALDPEAHLDPDILIGPPESAYSHRVDATGATSARPAVGAFAGAPPGEAAGADCGRDSRRAGGPLRGDRRLQPDRRAGTAGAGHGGSGGVADERSCGHTVGPLAAFLRTRDRAGGGVAA